MTSPTIPGYYWPLSNITAILDGTKKTKMEKRSIDDSTEKEQNTSSYGEEDVPIYAGAYKMSF